MTGKPAYPTSLIRAVLREFVESKATSLAGVSPRLVPFVRSMTEILKDGAGRPFPAFCYWGWRAAGGDAGDQRVIRAAAALELLHAGALIHDEHLAGGGPDFGGSAAILLGDLCLTWCAELFYGCGLPAGRLDQAAGPFHLMHTEVLAGTYLGLVDQALATDSVERARLVVRYKSAGFAVQRPMQVGAALAGASADLLEEYSAFALPLGEAVQLRAEVLGVFGDGDGKPAGDDLRLGKATVLITEARRRGNPGQRAELQALYGDPHLTAGGAERLRGIITGTRALAVVEELIVRQVNEALGAIHRLPAGHDVKEALTALAVATADGAGS